MNYNKKPENPINLMLNCLKSAAAGLVVFLFTTFIFALILTYTDFSDEFIKILSYLSVILSSYVTSFLAIKLIKKNGIITGLVSGLFVFLFIIILKLIFVGKVAFGINLLVLFIITIGISIINAIILVNKKRKIR